MKFVLCYYCKDFVLEPYNYCKSCKTAVCNNCKNKTGKNCSWCGEPSK